MSPTSTSEQYVNDLFALDGQMAVVIGGTGVLGGALCRGLAAAGAKVVVAGRSEERGAERVDDISRAGGEAAFARVDVTSHASIKELVDVALTHGPRIDILINGAGVNWASTYLEVEDDDWQRVLQSNLTAVHWGCQEFGRQMIDQGRGSILNIASVTSDRPLSRVFAYSASKAAVVNLTQNVAREFAPHGVRVNALAPGFFPAEQNRKILDPQRTQSIMSQTPMARFGEPEELIGAALLLLSARAGSFITGTCLYVDGGFTATHF